MVTILDVFNHYRQQFSMKETDECMLNGALNVVNGRYAGAYWEQGGAAVVCFKGNGFAFTAAKPPVAPELIPGFPEFCRQHWEETDARRLFKMFATQNIIRVHAADIDTNPEAIDELLGRNFPQYERFFRPKF